MPPRCLIPPPPGVWPRVPCAPPLNAAPAHVPFVASRWNLHIGQVRTEIWTVPPLIARIIPGRKNVSGAELNPLSRCGVNHALHQADDSVAAAAGLRRFSGGGCGCAARRPRTGIVDPRTRNLARRRFATGKCSEFWNALPAEATRFTLPAPSCWLFTPVPSPGFAGKSALKSMIVRACCANPRQT